VTSRSNDNSQLRTHFPHLVVCRETVLSPEGDTFPDLLLHGGSIVAGRADMTAVLTCLRWPSVSEYSIGPLQTPEWRNQYLASLPLGDSALLARLRAIRDQHLVVSVARGAHARSLRAGRPGSFFATAPVLQTDSGPRATFGDAAAPWSTGLQASFSPFLPPGDYVLESVVAWDAIAFQFACEAVQTAPDDRAFVIALGIVYSCVAEPYLDDGRPRPRGKGERLVRYTMFPRINKAIGSAAHRAAARGEGPSEQAVLYRYLAEAFVEVVREAKIDFSKPNLSDSLHARRPKQAWGAWLPKDQQNRVQLQSLILHRVQRKVRDRLLPRTAYHPRSYGTHRKLTAAWSALASRDQERALRVMRNRLSESSYRIFRACLEGLKLVTIARELGLSRSAVSQRLKSTILPLFFRVATDLRSRTPRT
jgi:hypothetical protein